MAKLSITGFLSKWLTKFASTGSGTITGAFMREFRQDISDSFLNVTDGVSEVEVDTEHSSGVLSLDFSLKWDGLFSGSVSFSTAKTLALTNNTFAKKFKFLFEISDTAAELELPSDFVLSDANWERTTSGTWAALDTGTYLMEGVFLDSKWVVKITGPYS